jgi:hypothetical protein
MIARFRFDADRMNCRAGSVNGSGRSSAASTMLKTAVLSPMPIAMIATATSVNSRAFRRDRIAYRMMSSARARGAGFPACRDREVSPERLRDMRGLAIRPHSARPRPRRAARSGRRRTA